MNKIIILFFLGNLMAFNCYSQITLSNSTIKDAQIECTSVDINASTDIKIDGSLIIRTDQLKTLSNITFDGGKVELYVRDLNTAHTITLKNKCELILVYDKISGSPPKIDPEKGCQVIIQRK